MAKAYSEDLGEGVIEKTREGLSPSATAQLWKIGVRTVERYAAQGKGEGHVKPKKVGGHKRPKLERHKAKGEALVTEDPDPTWAELQARLKEAKIKVSPSALDRFLKAAGRTYKKTLVATEQKRKDVVEARTAWREAQKSFDPARLVFIDETGASTAMTRRYGPAPKGERLIGYAPNGPWITTTFIAALRYDRLTAPAVFDRPIDGESFLAYVPPILVPTLNPDDIVVRDNLPAHKVDGVRQAREAARATRLLLPSCTPDLNPSQQVCSQLKSWLPKHS